MKAIKLIPTVFVLSACVMAGKPFWQPADFKQLPASGKTRMVFYWPKYEYDIMPNGARIFINDEFTESIGYLKYHAADTIPGDKTIAVDAWKTPGKCTLAIATKADEKRFFEISLRSDHVTKMSTANAMSQLPGGGAVAAVAITHEALSKECSGMFRIVEVSEAHALSRMQSQPKNTP